EVIGVAAAVVLITAGVEVTEAACVAELQELNPIANNKKKWQKRPRFPNIVRMSCLRLMNYFGNITRAQNIYPLPKDCFRASEICELCPMLKRDLLTVHDIPMCLPE